MICPKCGKETPDGGKFCMTCGYSFENANNANNENASINMGGNPAQQPQPDTQSTAGYNANSDAQGANPVQQPQQSQQTQQPQQPQQQPNTQGYNANPNGVGNNAGNANNQPQQMYNIPAGSQASQGGNGAVPVSNPVSGITANSALIRNIIIIAGVVFALIVGLVLFFVFHKKTIDLQKYAQVKYEGYDGYGTAKSDFKWEAFYADFAKAAKIDTKKIKDIDDFDDLNDLAGALQAYAKYEGVLSSIGMNIDKTEGLKNGDTVKVKFKFNNDIAKKYKIKFKGADMDFKVSGLKEVKEIDPFKDLKVSFENVSPNATVKIENNSSEEAVKSLYFSADKSSGLKLGDTVKISFGDSEKNEEYYIKTYGVKFTSIEKEYKVENVDSYFENADDLDDKVLNSMKKQTKDVAKSYLAGVKSDVKSAGLKYAGFYFLTAKDQSTWGYKNIVYMVYKASVRTKRNGKKFGKKQTVYFPVKFTNVIKYADGTSYVDLNSTYIEGYAGPKYGWFSNMKGYAKVGNMTNTLVTSQKSSYNAKKVGI